MPAGRAVRPTSDRVREALFATVGDRVVGADVLDLYAGSGALGIEALSRGAARATFVERDRAVVRVLRRNLADLGLTAEVVVADAARFASGCPRSGPARRHDLVLCDPPYAVRSADVVAMLADLVAGGRLAGDAMMIVERARHGDALDVPAEVGAVVDVRRYGDTVLYYVRRSTSDGEG